MNEKIKLIEVYLMIAKHHLEEGICNKVNEVELFTELCNKMQEVIKTGFVSKEMYRFIHTGVLNSQSHRLFRKENDMKTGLIRYSSNNIKFIK